MPNSKSPIAPKTFGRPRSRPRRAIGVALGSAAISHVLFVQWNGPQLPLMVLEFDIVYINLDAGALAHRAWVAARFDAVSGWILGIVGPLVATGWALVEVVLAGASRALRSLRQGPASGG